MHYIKENANKPAEHLNFAFNQQLLASFYLKCAQWMISKMFLHCLADTIKSVVMHMKV